MMTLRELGENLEKLNAAYAELKKKYGKPEVGKIIEVAGITWIVLDKLEKGYLVISDEFYGDSREFDDNSNNWHSSALRNELSTDFRKKIEDSVGEGALLKFTRDLLSMDGQTEYGTCEDYVSLLTVDEYRKYRKHLPNMQEWWWLITPNTTPCNNNSSLVQVVSPSGNFSISNFNCSRGVRPVCIFSSLIFESCKEDDE